jgi:hypothetical protein
MKARDTILIIGAMLVIVGLFVFGVVVPGNLSVTSKEASKDNSAVLCGSDISSTVTFTAYNSLNDTAKASRDQSLNLYQIVDGKEQYVAVQSDLTAGQYTAVCGQKYVARLVSASGKGTVISKVSGGASTIDGGKAIEFTASKGTTIDIYTKDISGISVKAYDNRLKGDIYNTVGASATDFETTGVTFTSTTNNATAMAIGLGEKVDVTVTMNSVNTYSDVADQGMYILVDASVTDYDTPVISLNGVTLTEATLVGSESKAYSSYEYAYRVPASQVGALIAYNSDAELRVKVPTVSGVNPTSDIVVAIAPIGAVSKVASNELVYQSVDDSSSKTAVYTLQTMTFDLS